LGIGQTPHAKAFSVSTKPGQSHLSIVNVLIHTRDGWTSVVPSGIAMSAIVAILLLVAGLRGWCVTGLKAPARGENA